MKYFPNPYRRIRRTIQSRPGLANATIMPASLLPFKAKYTHVANQLPTGSVLILTPPHTFSKQRSTLVKVAEALRSNGHLVKTLPFSQIG